jgi:hypothetical protein
MSRTLKVAIVVLCFSLCGVGAFITSIAREEHSAQKTDVIPVKHRDVVRRVWIQV